MRDKPRIVQPSVKLDLSIKGYEKKCTEKDFMIGDQKMGK